MKTTKILTLFVFLAFFGLNVYAVITDGLIEGIVHYFKNTNSIGYVLTTDLVIALGMVSVWMWRDAKKTGRNSLPYLMLTATTGSLGPLFYLLRKEEV